MCGSRMGRPEVIAWAVFGGKGRSVRRAEFGVKAVEDQHLGCPSIHPPQLSPSLKLRGTGTLFQALGNTESWETEDWWNQERTTGKSRPCGMDALIGSKEIGGNSPVEVVARRLLRSSGVGSSQDGGTCK